MAQARRLRSRISERDECRILMDVVINSFKPLSRDSGARGSVLHCSPRLHLYTVLVEL